MIFAHRKAADDHVKVAVVEAAAGAVPAVVAADVTDDQLTIRIPNGPGARVAAASRGAAASSCAPVWSVRPKHDLSLGSLRARFAGHCSVSPVVSAWAGAWLAALLTSWPAAAGPSCARLLHVAVHSGPPLQTMLTTLWLDWGWILLRQRW